MASTPEPTRTPIDIQDIEIRLISLKNEGVVTKSARYDIQVIFETGEIKVLFGNLIPHLTGAQINQLNAFMGALRTQAEAQILP